jgi:hypothetical protein
VTPPSVEDGAFGRLGNPQVLVPRERDPLTGRLTRAGDDRPGKRRRSPDHARPRLRLSRGIVIAAAVLGGLLIAGVAFAVSSGSDDDGATAPSRTAPASTADDDDTGAGALATLEGTWRFVIAGPRVNFVAGRYTAAQTSLTLAGNEIRLEARIGPNDFHRATFRPLLAGEHEISCSADSCGSGSAGFVIDGNQIRLVDRASLEPDSAGAGRCGAPAVANAGIVRKTGASSFRFLIGDTSQAGSDCFQVVWTFVATKV